MDRTFQLSRRPLHSISEFYDGTLPYFDREDGFSEPAEGIITKSVSILWSDEFDGSVIGTLEKGNVVSIIDRRMGRYEVLIDGPDSMTAWIKKADLEIVDKKGDRCG